MNLDVQISANAPANKIVGWFNGRLKIKVKAPAVEGKANAELLRFLAEELDIRVSQLRIVRGGTTKLKTIAVEGLEEAQVLERLAES